MTARLLKSARGHPQSQAPRLLHQPGTQRARVQPARTAPGQSRSVPLLERLKFLCIVSTNLDEFFEIRVSGLKQRAEMTSGPAGPDMMTPRELLHEISLRAHELVAEQYRLLNEDVIPALNAEGIRFVRRSDVEHAAARLAAGLLRPRDRARAEPGVAGSGAALSRGSSTRASTSSSAWRARTPSGARCSAPSSRRRDRCRA